MQNRRYMWEVFDILINNTCSVPVFNRSNCFKSRSVGTVAGAVFGCLAFIGLVVLAVTIFCWWKKGRQSGTQRTLTSTSGKSTTRPR